MNWYDYVSYSYIIIYSPPPCVCVCVRACVRVFDSECASVRSCVLAATHSHALSHTRLNLPQYVSVCLSVYPSNPLSFRQPVFPTWPSPSSLNEWFHSVCIFVRQSVSLSLCLFLYITMSSCLHVPVCVCARVCVHVTPKPSHMSFSTPNTIRGIELHISYNGSLTNALAQTAQSLSST